MQFKSKNIFEFFALYSFALYMVSLYLFADNLDTYTYTKLNFAVFVVFSCIYILIKKRLYLHPFIAMLTVFVVFCMMSRVWAIEKNLAEIRILTLIQLYISAILIYKVFYISKRINFLICCLYFSGVALCLFSFIIYTPNELINMLLSNERFGIRIADVNIIGTNLSITILIGLYYIFNKKKRIHLLVVIVATLLMIATGSKTALVIILAGIITLLYLAVGTKSKLRFMLVISVLILFFYIILYQSWCSQLFHRLNMMFSFIFRGDISDVSSYKRWELIKYGFKLFKEKPILGYGIGVSYTLAGTYFHNNYIQLLVEVGLIGFLTYYSIYIYIVRELYKLVKYKRNSVSILILTTLAIILVSDIAISTYYHKITYVFLAMAFAHVKLEKDRSICSRTLKKELYF